MADAGPKPCKPDSVAGNEMSKRREPKLEPTAAETLQWINAKQASIALLALLEEHHGTATLRSSAGA
jgi:hypothetical protein